MNKKNTTVIEDIHLTPDTPKKRAFNWYPGHMAKATREIKEKLKLVDIVLEIRDARAPLATGNRSLDELFRQKNRLILLNKVNLADTLMMKVWDEWFKKSGDHYLFIDCFDKNTMKKVLHQAREIVENKKQELNPETYIPQKKIRLMVIGLPNTGKSTIINQLAGRSATKTADRPGLTQTQQWIEIDKDLKLLDTPGVMPPMLAKEEHGLWLSAIHAIPDEIVGEEAPALFLIDYFIKNKSKEFQARYKLESIDVSIDEILEKIAQTRGCIKQKGLPDLERVYKLILNDFRKGDLGKVCFGEPPSY